jgi:hypothetical protein
MSALPPKADVRIGPSHCALGSNNNVEALAAILKCGRGHRFLNSDPRKGPVRKRRVVALRFTTERGDPFSTSGFARMVELAGREATLGFKAHPHNRPCRGGFRNGNWGKGPNLRLIVLSSARSRRIVLAYARERRRTSGAITSGAQHLGGRPCGTGSSCYFL